MDVLGKLFSSQALVKIMRLFLFNPDQSYDNTDIAKHAKVRVASVRFETKLLSSIGFIKKKIFVKDVIRKRRNRRISVKKRVTGWVLDQNFPYLKPLHSLLVNAELLSGKEIVSRLKGSGSLKLVLVSGVFLQDKDSRVDLLVVGDRIKKSALERAIKLIESTIGTELRYAFFETSDFEYRLGIYDKLIRDILDYSHQKVLNKLDI